MVSSPWSSQANQLCNIETKLHVTCNAGVSDHDLMFSKKAEDSGMQRGEHRPEPLDSRQAARPPPQSAVRQRMANAAGNTRLLLCAFFVHHISHISGGHAVLMKAAGWQAGASAKLMMMHMHGWTAACSSHACCNLCSKYCMKIDIRRQFWGLPVFGITGHCCLFCHFHTHEPLHHFDDTPYCKLCSKTAMHSLAVTPSS